jgi:hypothetical protein
MVRVKSTFGIILALGAALSSCSGRTRPSETDTAAATKDSFIYMRSYKDGERYRYELTTRSFANGKPTSTTRAVAEFRSVLVPVPHDVITWLHLDQIAPENAKKNLDAEARKVDPYRVSLHPRGSLKLPSMDVPAMVGPIGDLTAFLVSVSPSVGSGRIKAVGQRYAAPGPVIGRWTNKTNIKLGEDCVTTAITMTRLTREKVEYTTTFSPPAKTCLKHAAPWMSKPVSKTGLPNNIQQIRRAAGGKVSVMYGLERFTVKVTVERSTGKILSGTMDNELVVRIRAPCAPDLSKCAVTMPVKIQRKLTLVLKNP